MCDDSYASDPKARIAMMDKQGIEATLMFPSTGVTIENLLRDDPELLLAHVRAFNRWLADCWSFDFEHRIFSPAIISLVDPDEAVQPAGVRSRPRGPGGADAARTGPVGALARRPDLRSVLGPGPGGRSAGDLPPRQLGLHGALLGRLGREPRPGRDITGRAPVHRRGCALPGQAVGRSAFQWTMLYRDRPIMDTLAILIYHNLFGRFPGVQVMSVENGVRLGRLSAHGHGQHEGHGPQRPLARRLRRGQAQRGLQAPRVRLTAPLRRGPRRAGRADRGRAGPVRIGLPPRRGHVSRERLPRARPASSPPSSATPTPETRQVMRDNGMRLLGISK